MDGRPRLARLRWWREIFGLAGVVIWKIARGTVKKEKWQNYTFLNEKFYSTPHSKIVKKGRLRNMAEPPW